VISVAERCGLEHKTDAAGNVVVRKPASAGATATTGTVLQCHLDMVNDKNSDVEHDFDRDPIVPQRDGEYLKATGTTLGADNGVGVAAMLAVMEDREQAHGPLEFLFTIDEETGLTGALELSSDMLEGRFLLNLDTEEEGELTIGCAGGGDTSLKLTLTRRPSDDDHVALQVKLAGLKGGHSGIDIHLQRGNATQLLARALYAAQLEHPFQLASIEGGNKHNAIPREAFATLVAPADRVEQIRTRLSEELTAIAGEYRVTEPDLAFEIQNADRPSEVCDSISTVRVLSLICALPHGVVAMSNEIDGLVETSSNLAVVEQRDETMSILMSSRSSVLSALEATRRRIQATSALAGAQVEQHPGYPNWEPNLDSQLLSVLKPLHLKVIGREAHVAAVHAGLECGIIGDRYDGMDMISFGPQIEFPHSPDERVKIDTVGRFYQLLRATLEELARA
jgi:dipeptidase D